MRASEGRGKTLERKGSEQFVVFRLNGRRYAVPLPAVERFVRAAEVTPLPKAPDVVMGVIDVGGRVLPVLNTRRRFSLPEREIAPADQFLIARTGWRTVILVVDEAEGVVGQPSGGIADVSAVVPGLEEVPGVVVLEDGLVVIYDLEKFLSLEEAGALDKAMN